MRDLFHRCAVSRGLVPPADVLLTNGVAIDDALVARLGAGLERFEVADVEQFGYAYESLLAAADRKHAGAHYTPRSLADEIVEHALAPLVVDRSPDELLDLRILDIATGSGIFLVSAAHYLVARFPDGPGLREVITHCLYGADVNETSVEICRLSLWLLAGDQDLPLSFLDDKIRLGDSLVEVEGVGDRVPVNWAERAPAVMAAGGFDAVIGNPPFLGVKNIRSAVGREVRNHYATTLLDGESGRSDLVVFFLAQATRLSANIVALVVPDAISEGDSARFGPGRALANGYRLYRAETTRPWPSAAGVRIALIWLQRVGLGGTPAVLDGHEVAAIGPNLGRAETSSRRGRETPDWMPHGHQASIVLGKSLVLSRDAAAALIAADPRTSTWIKDYLSGDDLVSTVGPTSSRHVLDLGSADLGTLRGVPALAQVLDAVHAEREDQFAKYPQLVNRWWGFLNKVDRLYDALDGMPEAIAFSKHAKYIWPVLVATGPVFSNGTIVYPTADRALYAFLASTPHRLWAVDEGGSRLNQSFRYNPSRLLASYPFPDSFEVARDAGEQLAAAIAVAQGQLGLGITDLLNQVHRNAPVAGVVADIRGAIVEVDRAVLAAHGISEAPVFSFRTVGGRSWFGPDLASELAIKARLLG